MDLECQETAKNGQAVLQGVIAYVEVRSSSDNRSAAISHELRLLGAQVEPTFSDKVTHVVYKEGLKRTWIKANKKGVPMVSVSWLESCKREKRLMPEAAYPAILPEECDNSPLPKIKQTVRWKKTKSMQPCDFDEELARSAERGEKRRKRVLMANRFKLAEESTPTSSPIPILALETQPRSPMMGYMSQTGTPIPETPPSLMERLMRMKRGQKQVLSWEESPTKAPKPLSEKLLQTRLIDKLTCDFTGTSSDDDRDGNSVMVNQLIQRLDSDKKTIVEQSSKDKLTHPSTSGCNFEAPPSPANSSKSSAQNSPVCRKLLPNRRTSQRRSTAFPSTIHNNERNTEEGTKRLSIGSENLKKNSYDVSVLRGSESLSQALSPKDVNISTPVIQHDNRKQLSPSQEHVNPPVTSHNGTNNVNGDVENSGSKGAKRRRSMRVMSRLEEDSISKASPSSTKSIAYCDGQSIKVNDENSPSKQPVSLTSRPTKKMRKLFTEPNLDTSLPRPKVTNQTSPDAVGTGSDVFFLFGSTGKRKFLGRKNDSSKANICKRLTSDADGTLENDIPNRKANKGHPNSSTSEYSTVEDSTLNNDTLGQSMSVMYGNDTVLPSEICFKSRRSIDEFSLSKKPFNRKKKTLSNACRLRTIEDVDQSSSTSALTANNDNQPQCVKSVEEKRNPKRRRGTESNDESSSRYSTALSSKRQKCSSSSDSDGAGSLTVQEAAASSQPRLRHARSLVMEQAPMSESLPKQQYSLVVTSLHTDEQELTYSVIKKLGVFSLTNNVEPCSTHVICGEPRRTINLVKAIARGCWILSKDWIFKSLEAGQWLEEEEFEMNKDLPIVKKSRLLRQEAGQNYKLDLFSGVGSIYVARRCSPPRKELVHLIQLCSGKVTGTQSRASIFIGQEEDRDKTIIKPTWLLDSIMQLKCLPVDDYKLVVRRASCYRESSPEF